MGSLSGSDEGEIIESEAEKATTSQPSKNDTSVDRHARHRVPASRSPDENGPSRPYRDPPPTRRRDSPRGEKRSHDGDDDDDDDEYGERRRRPPPDPRDARRHDPRADGRFHDDRRRSRVSYADLDYGDSADPYLRYYDGAADDRYRAKRPRTRSRSPARYGRADQRRVRWGAEHGPDRRDSRARRDSRDSRDQLQDDRKRHRESGEGDRRNRDALTARSGHAADARSREPPHQTDKPGLHTQRNQSGLADQQPEEDMSTVREAEPVDEATLIEERRKRREAIKAKYRNQATPLLVQALQLDCGTGTDAPPTPELDSSRAQSTQPGRGLPTRRGGTSTDRRSGSARASGPSSPKDETGMVTPTGFMVTKDEDLANGMGEVAGGLEQDEPSAADYNPTMDMREDQMRNDQRQHADEVSSGAYDEIKTSHDVLIPARLADPEAKRKKRDEYDIFADDDDDDENDMFAESGTASKKAGDVRDSSRVMKIQQPAHLDMSMLDDWDDAEGYYRVILGELLDGRYHVQTNLGKGMFSGVVRAMDSRTAKPVAIKIIRSNETMKKAGLKEIDILQKLNQADPEDKKHMIRLERQFEHKGHLCMVFENLSINLREVLKKFGRDVGINLRAVRAYAQQIFLGLSLLRKCNFLHADLKPDNILVNESRNLLKICDLGSASDTAENEITPYLVSRFYRAPEIILGLPYDFAIDMWSVGCTLYELYTGKILFTGRTNNQMLRSIMECRGKFSHKMLRKAQFAPIHFDDLLNFKSVERDKLTGKDVVRTMPFTKPVRDLKARLLPPTSKSMGEAELKEVHLFIDLLDRCLNLNPEKRCTPLEALKHPFVYRAKP